MTGERLRWTVLVVILLMLGWLLGRAFWLPSSDAPDVGGESFRAWFWEARGLDLGAQIGLIMAGALGVAALLPRGQDES